MKKYGWLLMLLPIFAAAQTKEKPFTLSGTISNLPDTFKVQKVFLSYRVAGEAKSDSTVPVNGRYSFSGNIAEPTVARLSARYAPFPHTEKPTPKYSRDYATVYIEDGKQTVASTDSFSNIKVTGSDAHIAYQKLTSSLKPYNEKMEVYYKQYSEYAKAKDEENKKKVEVIIDSLSLVMNDEVYGKYVKANPKSPLAMYALEQYAGWDINADKVEPVYNTLSMGIRQYPSAIAFKERLEIAKMTGIGKMAMDFTQNDTLDMPVSLSSLKGKYVLVDFWASWCGPCRAENPAVVKVFNKYKDRNFHIIGVSLDREGQKEKWLKAIHDDGLAWTQVSDLKYWDNAVAKQYAIRAIPQNLLLDPSGKIIAKNLNGEELDMKLGEAIDGKAGVIEKKAF